MSSRTQVDAGLAPERPPAAPPAAPASPVKRGEVWFEGLLWASRLMVLVAVVASLVLAFGAFYIATVDVVYLLGTLPAYARVGLGDETRLALRADAIQNIVKAVDGYLIGAIMIIFGLGLYELFVSKIDIVEKSELGARLLRIHSIDELKNRLAKIILLVLVVKFFQQALDTKYGSPLDLLYLALGTLLVGAALYVSSLKGAKD